MTTSSGRVMFSVAEESFGSAVQELRHAFGRSLQVERAGPDLGVITTTAPGVGEVAAACLRRPLVFIRHLTVEMAGLSRDAAADIGTVTEAARSIVAGNRGELAIQTWVSGSPNIGYGSGELYQRLAEDLSEQGLSISRAGKRDVMSGCITPDGVLIGLNKAADSLSDWPGGRIRLSRDQDQVSRAEFKLEELFQIFSLRLPDSGLAVDLGASPGGWTRILRRQGLTVWAVDPADLDPRITADPGVHHVRTTAGEFFRSAGTRFDLAVNDMRMEPVLSCQVMLRAARLLRPGALAIVTLKTGGKRQAETVTRCLTLLGEQYEVVHARQLHHNRQEVTVLATARQQATKGNRPDAPAASRHQARARGQTQGARRGF